jgi:hypothetical protein
MDWQTLRLKKHQSSSRRRFTHQVAAYPDRVVDPHEPLWRKTANSSREFLLFEVEAS